MSIETFDNVWDAISETPEEAAHMTLRTELMIDLQRIVAGWNLTQTEAARRLGITQPRLNDLVRGRFNKFSLHALVDLVAKAGMTVHMEIRPKAA